MKKITITIVDPTIITNPPQPGKMDLKVEGLTGLEVINLLISAAAQMSGQSLPPLIAMMKKAEDEAKAASIKPN